MRVRLATRSALAEAASDLTHRSNRQAGLSAERRAELDDAATTLTDLIPLADQFQVTTVALPDDWPRHG